MVERIDRLLTALKSHKPESSQSADELVFQSLIESAGDPKDDQPPPPPEGVHAHVKEQPVYSKMMASLVDQVRKELQEKKASGSEIEAWIGEVTGHREKIEGLQKELNTKLKELEVEEKKFITSDDLHEGFNFSNVGCRSMCQRESKANKHRYKKTSHHPQARRRASHQDRNCSILQDRLSSLWTRHNRLAQTAT